jgi:Restriction endonuclease
LLFVLIRLIKEGLVISVMDVYTLLEQCERLLALYGYETERDVGIAGRDITLADLTRETQKGAPTRTSDKIFYRADILAEKSEIERPYGRIVVMYNRTPHPASPTQITHLAKVMEHAQAYLGLFITVTGASPDAVSHASNNNVRIIGPDEMETLIGKSAIEKPWWQNVNALPTYFTYEEMVQKIEHEYEHYFHLQWSVSQMSIQELAYLPYWKIAYQVREKTKVGEDFFDSGVFGINAHTGMVDIWRDIDDIAAEALSGWLEG